MILFAAVVVAMLGFPVARSLMRRRWLVVTVIGNSMAPTLRHGQKLIARRVRRARGPSRLSRRDVVVFRLSPERIELDDAEDLLLRVKRIAAVENDPLPNWLRSESWASGSARVPPGKLIVAGDNPRSQGSRELGYIDEGDVIAVVRIKSPTRYLGLMP